MLIPPGEGEVLVFLCAVGQYAMKAPAVGAERVLQRLRVQHGQVDRIGKVRQAVVQRVEIFAVVRRKRQQRRECLMQRLAAVQRPPVEIDLHHDSSP